MPPTYHAMLGVHTIAVWPMFVTQHELLRRYELAGSWFLFPPPVPNQALFPTTTVPFSVA